MTTNDEQSGKRVVVVAAEDATEATYEHAVEFTSRNFRLPSPREGEQIFDVSVTATPSARKS